MTAMLIMFCDLTEGGRSLGWRTWSRIIAGVSLALRAGDITIYTAATRTGRYPKMPCDAAQMQEMAIHSFAPDVPVVVLPGDEEWSSRGELRKLFSSVLLGEKVILVSGRYHLDRLQDLVEEHHPEFAPYVEYYEVACDRLGLFGRCVEFAKRLLAASPGWFQGAVRSVLGRVRSIQGWCRTMIVG